MVRRSRRGASAQKYPPAYYFASAGSCLLAVRDYIYIFIYLYMLIYGPVAWGATRSCVHAPPSPPYSMGGYPTTPHTPPPHPPYPPPAHSHGGEGYIDICVYTYIYILYQHGNGSIRFGWVPVFRFVCTVRFIDGY